MPDGMDEMSNAELVRSLNRIEQKLDRVTGDHEDRLRRIEKTMWIMVGLSSAGATSGIGALLSGVLR